MPGRAKALTLAMWLAAAAAPGVALGAEPDDDDFHSGYIPSSSEEVEGLPVAPLYTNAVPARIDLSAYLPPVGDQGKIGSCTAWASGYAGRALYVSWLEGRDVSKPENVPSPEFIYDSINSRPGDCDGGSSVAKALNFLKEGVPSLADAPYDDEAMLKAKCERPSAERAAGLKRDFFAEAPYKLDLSSVDQAKAELAQGHPVIIGMAVGHHFHGLPPGVTYQGEWRGYYSASFRQTKRRLGGHALTIIGYDDERRAFKLVNSWGTKWGDQGFGWLSYDAFVDYDIVHEAMTTRPAKR